MPCPRGPRPVHAAMVSPPAHLGDNAGLAPRSLEMFIICQNIISTVTPRQAGVTQDKCSKMHDFSKKRNHSLIAAVPRSCGDESRGISYPRWEAGYGSGGGGGGLG